MRFWRSTKSEARVLSSVGRSTKNDAECTAANNLVLRGLSLKRYRNFLFEINTETITRKQCTDVFFLRKI